jgi:hypothetical protein
MIKGAIMICGHNMRYKPHRYALNDRVFVFQLEAKMSRTSQGDNIFLCSVKKVPTQIMYELLIEIFIVQAD